MADAQTTQCPNAAGAAGAGGGATMSDTQTIAAFLQTQAPEKQAALRTFDEEKLLRIARARLAACAKAALAEPTPEPAPAPAPSRRRVLPPPKPLSTPRASVQTRGPPSIQMTAVGNGVMKRLVGHTEAQRQHCVGRAMEQAGRIEVFEREGDGPMASGAAKRARSFMSPVELIKITEERLKASARASGALGGIALPAQQKWEASSSLS